VGSLVTIHLSSGRSEETSRSDSGQEPPAGQDGGRGNGNGGGNGNGNGGGGGGNGDQGGEG
jgi:hypothetical protein